MYKLEEILNTVVTDDCLNVLKDLPDKSVDLVVTDPPYGINVAKNGEIRHPRKRNVKGFNSTKNYGEQTWDNKIPSKEYFDEMFRVSKNQIIFGGNYFVEYLSNSSCWLVWHKKEHDNSFAADCELAWTSFKTAVRYYKFGWVGLDSINNLPHETRQHPTQKPVSLMEWIIKNYSKSTDIILDPFAGSGSTLVAAQKLQRKFIGIEISPEYCKIAENRLKQKVLNF